LKHLFSSIYRYFVENLQDVTFKGDPSLKRISDLKAFMAKLKSESEEARRQANRDEYLALNPFSGFPSTLFLFFEGFLTRSI
jgi:hypothetical protein